MVPDVPVVCGGIASKDRDQDGPEAVVRSRQDYCRSPSSRRLCRLADLWVEVVFPRVGRRVAARRFVGASVFRASTGSHSRGLERRSECKQEGSTRWHLHVPVESATKTSQDGACSSLVAGRKHSCMCDFGGLAGRRLQNAGAHSWPARKSGTGSISPGKSFLRTSPYNVVGLSGHTQRSGADEPRHGVGSSGAGGVSP